MRPVKLLLDENLSLSPRTANVGDFEKLAHARDLHAGVMLVEDGNLTRDEQVDVLRASIAAIEGEYAAGRDLVNRIARVQADGSASFEDRITP